MGLTLNKLPIQTNKILSEYTTLGIGGPAKYLIKVDTEVNLQKAIDFAIGKKLPFLVIASGSDLLVSDTGFNGVVIVNKTSGITISGSRVKVKSGEILQNMVDAVASAGLGGMECMAGIPGSVGGAIYGNAGAYGQTISDHLTEVRFLRKNKIKVWFKAKCKFKYRESAFKKDKELIILSATFGFPKANQNELKEKSKEIISLRLKKYPLHIKCPGSFFKNVMAADLPAKVLSKIPEEKIMYGKIPAGYLLEEVGAKGDNLGNIRIADYHGNLFMNTGGGSAADFFALARKYKVKVYQKFGIKLEPEVQLIGFTEKL